MTIYVLISHFRGTHIKHSFLLSEVSRHFSVFFSTFILGASGYGRHSYVADLTNSAAGPLAGPTNSFWGNQLVLERYLESYGLDLTHCQFRLKKNGKRGHDWNSLTTQLGPVFN